METIDIGFKIIPKLYLHIVDDNEMAFEIDKIQKVEIINNVTIVSYAQDNFIVEYPVVETRELIDEHIEKAKVIKAACVDYVKNFE